MVGCTREALLPALAAGITVLPGYYVAGPVVSSVVSGVAGFAGSLATGVVSQIRRVLPLLVGGDS
jgi:hypothetical protein